MDRKKILIIAALIITLIVVFYSLSSGNDINSYELKKTDFKETISASGRVEATNRIDMIFQKTGTIEEIFAVEGQFYEKGDLLLALEMKEEENDLEAKNLQLQIANNELSNIEQREKIAFLNYEMIKANRENFELQLERNIKLYDAGAISKKTLEDLELNLREIKNQEAISQMEYQNLSQGGYLREKAKIEVDNARNFLERSELEKNKKMIYAPFSGQVLEITKENFSNVQIGEVALVYAGDRAYIISDIDERDYQKVRPGQKAFVQFINDNQILEGIVRDVSPVIDRTRGTIRVRIDLIEDKPLKIDVGVNVEIIVNEFEQQILVPKNFVFKEPLRIIINDRNISKVVELQEFEDLGEFYLIKGEEITNYLGMEIVDMDIQDGEKIR